MERFYIITVIKLAKIVFHTIIIITNSSYTASIIFQNNKIAICYYTEFTHIIIYTRKRMHNLCIQEIVPQNNKIAMRYYTEFTHT